MFLTFGDDRLDFVEVCLKRKIVELLEAQRISCEITISDRKGAMPVVTTMVNLNQAYVYVVASFQNTSKCKMRMEITMVKL